MASLYQRMPAKDHTCKYTLTRENENA